MAGFRPYYGIVNRRRVVGRGDGLYDVGDFNMEIYMLFSRAILPTNVVLT